MRAVQSRAEKNSSQTHSARTTSYSLSCRKVTPYPLKAHHVKGFNVEQKLVCIREDEDLSRYRLETRAFTRIELDNMRVGSEQL